MVVKFRKFVLLAVFASTPALAGEIQFEGRSVETGGDAESPTLLRMSGPRYGINASSAQILDKAQACVSRIEGVSGATVEAGVLSAEVHADHRAMFSSHSVRSVLAIEATDGYFSISQSELAYSPALAADTPEGGYRALVHSGADWDNALETAIRVEDGIVDCLYR